MGYLLVRRQNKHQNDIVLLPEEEKRLEEIVQKMQAVEIQTKKQTELPQLFSDTLIYHMEARKISVSALAERSCVSERTIKRLRANDDPANIQTVLGLCIGLHLEPEFSEDLIHKAGFCFAHTDEHFRYQFVLHHMYREPITLCNKVLAIYHARPIGLRGEHLN